MSTIKLYNDDCLKVLKTLSDNSIDLIATDPFMGIGSNGIACKCTNRDFIGIEIDKKYFDIAFERIHDKEVKTNKKSLW